MADVRGATGVPPAGAFDLGGTPTPSTPIYVNLSNGDLYALIDGVVTLLTSRSTDAGLAAAGTNQATALALTSTHNTVTTVAADTGVVLSTLTLGVEQVVYNGGANTLNVYPPTGGKINQLATNAPIVLPVNTEARFWRSAASQWIGSRSA